MVIENDAMLAGFEASDLEANSTSYHGMFVCVPLFNLYLQIKIQVRGSSTTASMSVILACDNPAACCLSMM